MSVMSFEPSREQESSIEILSLNLGGIPLEVAVSERAIATAITEDNRVFWFDEDGMPACPTHEVFNCPKVRCQVEYAMEGF